MKRFGRTMVSITASFSLIIYQTALVMAASLGSPLPPTGLTASVASATQVNLTWEDNSDNESGFRIERAISGSGSFSTVNDTSANITSFSDMTVTINTTYQYRVLAFNTNGDSDYSNVVSVTVTVPNPSSNLVATVVNASRIDLSWTDNSNDESGFRLERSTDNFTVTANVTLAANTTSFNDTTVTANASYQYRVISFNVVGDSASSNVALATAAVPSPSLLSPVNGAFINDITPDLSWNALSNVPGVTYRVEIDNSENFSSPEYAGDSLLSSNATSTELTDGNYYWRVNASDNASNVSAWSAIQQFSVDTVTPAAPTLKSPPRGSVQHSHEIQFEWNSVSDPSGVTYHIVVFDADFPDIQDERDISGTSTSFLLYDNNYGWNVTAVDGAGNEGPVSVNWYFQVLNEDTPPPEVDVTSPIGGEELVGDSTFAITWFALPADNTPTPELKIDIFFSPDNGDNFEHIVHLEDNPGAFQWRVPNINTDQGLIRVDATDRHDLTGRDVSDAAFSITATAGSPSGLTTMATSATQVQLSWSHNGNFVGEFLIERSRDNFASIDATFSAPADARTFVDSIVQASTTYYYRASAVNQFVLSVSSTPSNIVSVTTPAPSPPPPLESQNQFSEFSLVPLTTAVSLSGLVGDKELKVDTTGKVIEKVKLSETGPNSTCSLEIPAGTTMKTLTGAPLNSVSMTQPLEVPAAPPQNTIVLVEDFGPQGATFDPAITLTMTFDPASLPAGTSETDLVIASWDGSQWTIMETQLDAEANTVSTQVTHFSMFGILAKIQPPAVITVSIPSQISEPALTTVPVPTTEEATSTVPYPAIIPVHPATAPEPSAVTIPTPSAPPTPTSSPAEGGTNWWFISGLITAAITIIVALSAYFIQKQRKML